MNKSTRIKKNMQESRLKSWGQNKLIEKTWRQSQNQYRKKKKTWHSPGGITFADIIHALGPTENASIILNIKKLKKKYENNTLHDPDNYIKYSYKSTKTPLKAKLVFCLF